MAAPEDQLKYNVSDYEYHLKTKHQEHLETLSAIPIMRCSLCAHSFEKLQHLHQDLSLHADGKTGIDFKSCIYVTQFESSVTVDYDTLQRQIQNDYSKRQISRFYQAIDKYGNEMDVSDSESSTEETDCESVVKDYKCDVCKEHFKKRKYILNHQLERHHDEQMPFTCKDCNQQFVIINLLQTHLKRECWNKYRRIAEQCEFCNVRFIWPNNSLKHKEMQHHIATASLLPKDNTEKCFRQEQLSITDMANISNLTVCTQTTPKTENHFMNVFFLQCIIF